ncbi:hypothetical protein D3C86_1045720 [compost metagenome]
MQRRHAHGAFEPEGFEHPLRVDAAGHALVHGDATLAVLHHGLRAVESVEADAQDQVALRQVFVVEKDLHAVERAQARRLRGAVEQRRQQRALVQLDALDARHEAGAAVGRVGEVAAEPAHVVDDLGEHRELPRRRAAQLPVAGLLAGQLVVRQCSRALRHPREARAAAAEELVGREVDAVHRRLLQVDDAVRRVLHGIDEDVQVGLDLARAPHDGRHVELGARDVRRMDHVEHTGVLVDQPHDGVHVDAAGDGVALRHPQFAPEAFGIQAHGVEGRGVLERGRDHVRARHVLGHRAHHVEHRARSGERGVHAAAGGVEDGAQVVGAARLHGLQLDGGGVDALGVIGNGVDLREALDRGLEPERAAGVVEVQALAAVVVAFDAQEALAHLAHQRIGKELAFRQVRACGCHGVRRPCCWGSCRSRAPRPSSGS